MSDTIKLETREYHQSTHYLNREIPKEDIIEAFGSVQKFEDAIYQDYESDDYDAELADKVWDFVNEYDYERVVDEWTHRKGGYDGDDEIVEEFTLTDNR